MADVREVEVLGTRITLQEPSNPDEVADQIREQFPTLGPNSTYTVDEATNVMYMDAQAGRKG